MMNPYSEKKLKALSIDDLVGMKKTGEKITCLTAYDASFSSLLDRMGIDVMLVGDSLGMVIQGQASTIPVTVEHMIYHSQCVSRVRQRAFIITDLPFSSYSTTEKALDNAARIMQQGGAQMVKLEGPHFKVIQHLAEQGIPVCAHLGLLPQSINQLGSYKVQGKEPVSADQILNDALKAEESGAAMLVLECIPALLAAEISKVLSIPVIGIGAGVDCDGQVLVLYDILNINSGRRPKFYRDFIGEAGSIEQAVALYHQAVKQCQYPAVEHCY